MIRYKTHIVESFNRKGELEYTMKATYKKLQETNDKIDKIARRWLKKEYKDRPWNKDTLCIIFKVGEYGFYLCEDDLGAQLHHENL
jgi:hypothetical protein